MVCWSACLSTCLSIPGINPAFAFRSQSLPPCRGKLGGSTKCHKRMPRATSFQFFMCGFSDPGDRNTQEREEAPRHKMALTTLQSDPLGPDGFKSVLLNESPMQVYCFLKKQHAKNHGFPKQSKHNTTVFPSNSGHRRPSLPLSAPLRRAAPRVLPWGEPCARESRPGTSQAERRADFRAIRGWGQAQGGENCSHPTRQGTCSGGELWIHGLEPGGLWPWQGCGPFALMAPSAAASQRALSWCVRLVWIWFLNPGSCRGFHPWTTKPPSSKPPTTGKLIWGDVQLAGRWLGVLLWKIWGGCELAFTESLGCKEATGGIQHLPSKLSARFAHSLSSWTFRRWLGPLVAN